jgi:hypothetical protein
MPPRAARIRSRFDTSLGIVHYEVPQVAIPEVREMLVDARLRRDSDAGREAYVDLIAAWVQTNHYPLVAHEQSHVLQALTHPALLHRCLREFSLLMSVFHGVRHADAPLTLPLIAPPAWHKELEWTTRLRRLSLDPHCEPLVGPPGAGLRRRGELSEVDLLEDSAGIFQYKAEIGGQGSGRLYRRWLGDGSFRYRDTFDFLAAELGTEDGFVALPALVMAANTTNRPLDMFIALLAATRSYGISPSGLGIDRYWDFLTTFLRVRVQEGEARHPQELLDGDGPTIRIGRAGMLKMVDDLATHPLREVVRKACADERQLEELRAAILHPYRAFDRRLRRMKRRLRPFEPPVTVYRVVEEGVGPGDDMFDVSATVMEADPPGGDTDWVSFLMETVRIRNFVFANVKLRREPETNTCPHKDCQYHPLGMCRNWMHVPAAPDECRFPEWLRNSCLRSFDFERGVLELMPEGGVDG